MHLVAKHSAARAEDDRKLLGLDVEATCQVADKGQITRRRWNGAKPVERDGVCHIDESGGRRAEQMKQIRLRRLANVDLADLLRRNGFWEPCPAR